MVQRAGEGESPAHTSAPNGPLSRKANVEAGRGEASSPMRRTSSPRRSCHRYQGKEYKLRAAAAAVLERVRLAYDPIVITMGFFV